ncbi:MAG: hypothetical protein NVSMB42_11630 [Herpetosiphon sp.]
MRQRDNSSRLTRRRFLQAATATLGAVVAPNFLSARPVLGRGVEDLPSSIVKPDVSWSSAGKTIRIGALIPASSTAYDLAHQYLAGLTLGCQELRRSAGAPDVVLTTREWGGLDRSLEQQVEKLLNEKAADLLVGLVNTDLSPALLDSLARRQTYFITAGAGENVPRDFTAHPNVFHNTLGAWQSAWALGRWSAHNMGRRAVVATSLYDAGYDSFYAFRCGFEQGGGEILATNVTHHPGESTDLPALMNQIERRQPDFVYAAYCGTPAGEFMQAYGASGLHNRIPLAAAAFMVDEQLLPAHGVNALGTRTCAPWSNAGETPASAAWSTRYAAQMGRAPDAWALLGYETAHLVLSAAAAAHGDVHADRVGATLRKATLNSPRGDWSMNVATQTAASSLYIREVQSSGNVLRNVIIAKAEPIADDDTRLAQLRLSVKTGWTHPYLLIES